MLKECTQTQTYAPHFTSFLNFSVSRHEIPKQISLIYEKNHYTDNCTNLPYYCKHGIEVLAFSAMKGNFNKMFNNLHSFELIGFT